MFVDNFELLAISVIKSVAEIVHEFTYLPIHLIRLNRFTPVTINFKLLLILEPKITILYLFLCPYIDFKLLIPFIGHY